MTKRIVCMALSFIMVFGICAVDVGASIADSKEYYIEKFDTPGVVPTEWELKGEYGTLDTLDRVTAVINDGGYVELCPNDYVPGSLGIALATASVYPENQAEIPKDFTLTFDAKVIGDYSKCAVDVNLNAYRRETMFNEIIAAADTSRFANKWVTYVLQMSNGESSASMKFYYKLRDGETSSEPTDFDFKFGAEKTTSGTHATKRVQFYSADGNTTLYVDNVRVLAGTYVPENAGSITSGSDFITATTKVTAGNVDPVAGGTCTLVLAAFDKNGKILNMKFEAGKTLEFGDENNFTIQFPSSEAFLSKLQGGTVELYLCDSLTSLKPLSTALIKEIQ